MTGLKYATDEYGYSIYFYPEPEELRKRLAELKQAGLGGVDLKKIERFVAIYEAALMDTAGWVSEADPDPAEVDDVIEDNSIATELVGEELVWGDPKVLGPMKRRPPTGDWHREPVIIFHY